MHSPIESLTEAARLLRQDDVAAALVLADDALAVFRAAGDDEGTAQALDCLAQCHLHRGDLAAALNDAVRACSAWQRTANRAGQARARSEYARLLYELGRTRQAVEEGASALLQAEAAGDGQAIALACLNLGMSYWGNGQAEEALPPLRRAIDAAQAAGDQYLLARALTSESNVHRERLGRACQNGTVPLAEARPALAGAVAQHEAALLIARRIDAPWLANVIQFNLVATLLVMDDHDRAEHILLHDMPGAHGTARDEAGRHLLLGAVHRAKGRLADAIAAYELAREIAERADEPRCLSYCYEALSSAREQAGDLQAALDAHRRFHAQHVRMMSEAAHARARAEAALQEAEGMRTLAQPDRNRADKQDYAGGALLRASLEDALTGIANRRRFDEIMLQMSAAGSAAYSIALVDIDHFKRVNDAFSHLVGDEVLRRVGAILLETCRQGDIPARYGGEEFAVLLVNVEPHEALVACERIRQAIESHPWAHIDPRLSVTASIGAASRHEAATPQEMFALADQRLYAAKNAGRNRVQIGDLLDLSN